MKYMSVSSNGDTCNIDDEGFFRILSYKLRSSFFPINNLGLSLLFKKHHMGKLYSLSPNDSVIGLAKWQLEYGTSEILHAIAS